MILIFVKVRGCFMLVDAFLVSSPFFETHIKFIVVLRSKLIILTIWNWHRSSATIWQCATHLSITLMMKLNAWWVPSFFSLLWQDSVSFCTFFCSFTLPEANLFFSEINYLCVVGNFKWAGFNRQNNSFRWQFLRCETPREIFHLLCSCTSTWQWW